MWPKNCFKSDVAANVEHKRKTLKVNHTVFLSQTQCDNDFRLNPIHFSSWSRFLCVYAWVLRFLRNCQFSKTERRKEKVLHVEELKSVETIVISDTQQKNFQE